jgi:hypothetical protein
MIDFLKLLKQNVKINNIFNDKRKYLTKLQIIENKKLINLNGSLKFQSNKVFNIDDKKEDRINKENAEKSQQPEKIEDKNLDYKTVEGIKFENKKCGEPSVFFKKSILIFSILLINSKIHRFRNKSIT